MANLITYLKETKGELKHVRWPSNRHAWILTIVVIIFSLFVAAYLGAFDYLFTELLNILVS